MLKLRSIGLSDYSVLEGRQRIGRIRLATERIPSVWLWNVSVHLPGGGSSNAMRARSNSGLTSAAATLQSEDTILLPNA